MKSIFKSALILILANGLTFTSLAQDKEQIIKIRNNSDTITLQDLSNRFSREYILKRQRILELAQQNNWPLEIRKEDGRISVLQDIYQDTTPIYITTNDKNSAITSRADKIQPGGLTGLNLDGTGMLAGVWEPGLPLTSHLDFEGRVTGPEDNSKFSIYSHTTHVSGIIASSGANSTNYDGRGIAYKSNINFWDTDNDLSEMANAAAEKGLLVSNHSYGQDLSDYSSKKDLYLQQFGSYGNYAKDIDDVTFAAPYYQPVLSAGNDRAGYFSNGIRTDYNPGKEGHDLLTRYCTSKNGLVVAAVSKVLSYTNYQSVTMSTFSDWGPTDDNRIKPDISACGVNVNSTIYKSSDSTAKNLYGIQSGTSMSAPNVTGAILLIQQHYSNVNDKNFMRSATLRGLIAHCADEAGYYDGPDSRFGWGLINTERMANVISDKSSQKSIMLESNLTQDGSYSTTVFATGNNTPLIATLSWTERSGTANTTVTDLATAALVNDLDIKITKDGQAYLPWRLAGNLQAAAEKGDNVVDNLEKVELKLPESGIYTITISHKGTLTGGSQDYSLIVSGIEQSPLVTNQNDFKQFSVWPNPANDILNISIDTNLSEDAIVTVYDILGKKVKEQKLNNGMDNASGVINTNDLNSGIYLVKIIQGGKQSSRKIIKK